MTSDGSVHTITYRDYDQLLTQNIGQKVVVVHEWGNPVAIYLLVRDHSKSALRGGEPLTDEDLKSLHDLVFGRPSRHGDLDKHRCYEIVGNDYAMIHGILERLGVDVVYPEVVGK